jgi:hypothetical protein
MGVGVLVSFWKTAGKNISKYNKLLYDRILVTIQMGYAVAGIEPL